MDSFFIPGPLPGMNEIIRAAKRKGSKWTKRGKRWSAYNDMHAHWCGVVAMCACRVRKRQSAYFVFRWREKDRSRDKDNIVAARKFIFDGLVHCGVLPNDGWANVQDWTDKFEINRERPGVVVELRAEGI